MEEWKELEKSKREYGPADIEDILDWLNLTGCLANSMRQSLYDLLVELIVGREEIKKLNQIIASVQGNCRLDEDDD